MTFIASQFVDIHSHILPGFDDGPKTIGESLLVAKLYEKAGCKRVIATPHYIPGTAWAASQKKVLEAVVYLQKRLDADGVDLTIEPGMEIAYHKRLEENILNRVLLPLGKSDHYLIEPPFQGDLDGLLMVMKSLLAKKQKLILAHPERVDYFQQRPSLLKPLVADGLRIQVNSGSMLGYFGKKSKSVAKQLNDLGCVHFIASDTHDHTKRTPVSSREWDTMQEMYRDTKMLQRCNEQLSAIFTLL